jgi:hypothetical protein
MAGTELFHITHKIYFYVFKILKVNFYVFFLFQHKKFEGPYKMIEFLEKLALSGNICSRDFYENPFHAIFAGDKAPVVVPAVVNRNPGQLGHIGPRNF